MDWFDSWGLTLAVFLPAVGMVIVLAIPKAQERALKVATLATTLATLGVGIAILARLRLRPATGASSSTSTSAGSTSSTAGTTSGVDGISLRCSLLTMLITVLCVIYTWNHFPEPHNPKAFLALMLLLEAGMNGTFVAQDLILFFIFFEIVLLPMFFMIGVWGGPNREYASIKFFLFTLFGSAIMLLSFLALYFLTDGQTFDIPSAGGAARRRIAHEHADPDLRRAVPRVRDQGADVPVPHVAARRAHRSAHRRLGAAGGHPAEARDVRFHPDRAADPARSREELGALDRPPRGDRHHLRRRWLPRPDAT